MTIAFNCSDCGSPLKVADELGGKKCKCPKCSTVNVVPNDEGGAISTAPARTKRAADEGDDGGGAVVKKTKKAKAGGSKKLLLTCGILGVLGLGFLACAGVIGGFGIWYFFFSDPLKDEAKYFPTGTEIVASIRVDDLRKARLYEDMKKEVGNIAWEAVMSGIEGQTGIPVDDMDRVVFAGGSGAADPVVIVRTNKEVKPDDMIKAIKKKNPGANYEDTKKGDKKIYSPKDGFGQAFCVVDTKMVVFGKADELKKIIERDKAPDLSDNMKKMIGKASFRKTVGFAFALKDAKKGGGNFAGDIPPPEMGYGYVDIGKDIDASVTLIFGSSKDAESAKTKADKGIADMKKGMASDPTGKEFVDAVDVKVKQSGSDVTLDVTVKGSSLSKGAKSLGGKMPFPF
jgi:hypothetical protein